MVESKIYLQHSRASFEYYFSMKRLEESLRQRSPENKKEGKLFVMEYLLILEITRFVEILELYL